MATGSSSSRGSNGSNGSFSEGEEYVKNHPEVPGVLKSLYGGLGASLDLSGFSGSLDARNFGGDDATVDHILNYWLEKNPQYSAEELGADYDDDDYFGLIEGNSAMYYADKVGNDAQKAFSKWWQEQVGLFEGQSPYPDSDSAFRSALEDAMNAESFSWDVDKDVLRERYAEYL